MKIFDTTLRIDAGRHQIVVPITLSFADAPGHPLQLIEGEIVLGARRFPWTIQMGHLLDSKAHAAIMLHPKLMMTLCDRATTWPAKTHRRNDGMVTVMLGDSMDLARTRICDLISDAMRRAAENFGEVLGRNILKAS